MIDPYLDRLLVEKSKKDVPQAPTKPTKPFPESIPVGFVSFDGDQGSRFSQKRAPWAAAADAPAAPAGCANAKMMTALSGAPPHSRERASDRVEGI
jgi:hypothetical protein